MLNAEERQAIARRFEVSGQQVERDYLLSLLLAVLARDFADDVIFYGGTALARTHLIDGRLSEDLDLIASGPRTEVARRLDQRLPRSVQREFGRLSWRPALSDVRDTEPALLTDGRGVTVRVQLLSAVGQPRWPTESRKLHQRYRDAPPATLTVPTRSAFVAAKTVVWWHRRAPRDLWDLWALNRIGAITAEAAALFARHGPITSAPRADLFAVAPDQLEWETQLAGQTRLTVSAQDALDSVRDAWVQVPASP